MRKRRDDVADVGHLPGGGRSAECEGRPTGWLRVGAAGGSQEAHAWMPDLLGEAFEEMEGMAECEFYQGDFGGAA